MALLPQNQREQILLIVCVALAGLAYAYYQFLWTPKNTELDTLKARVDSLEARNDIARTEIARGTATKLKAEADEYGRMLTVMRQLVPVANEVPTLVDQISTAARRAGLEIGDITPGGILPGPVFDTYKYRMSVTGSYHRIGEFLGNVGSLTRIIAPMNLQVQLSGRQTQKARPGESLLDAIFDIQTYVAKTAPTSAPPAPAGTSTKRP